MVTNRVFKVLANNGTVMTNMADTTVGRYLVIKEDGSTVTATTALDREDKVQLVVNTAGGKLFSDRIRIADITAYSSRPYAAKVEQVVTVTPGAPVAGLDYTVAIINKDDKEILQARQSKRTYTVRADSGETATTLGNKFRALINADVASSVVASGTTTLVLTAKDVAAVPNLVSETPGQITFDVFLSVIDPKDYFAQPAAFGTIAATTAASFGSGNYFQIAKLEQRGIGYTGVTNRTKFPVEQGQSTAVAGTNYDVAVIEFDNRHDTNVVVEGEKRAPETLIVPVTAGASAGLFAIFARLASSGDVAVPAV